MVAKLRISGGDFLIHSLKEFTALIELAAPSPLALATDLLGKDQTILLRAGQPVTDKVIEFLKNSDAYQSSFAVKPTEELCTACRTELTQAILGSIRSLRIKGVSNAIAALGVPIEDLVSKSIEDKRITYTLFCLKRFGDTHEKALLEHLTLVAVLTAGIARLLDSRFSQPEMLAQAMQAGLLHDVTIPNYIARRDSGRNSLEEKIHQEEAGALLSGWGLRKPLVHAVRYHHAYSMEGQKIPKAPTDEALHLRSALNTAECFVTLREVLRNDDEASYLVAHISEQGHLEYDAVRALGTLIQSKQIITDVERLSELEHLCPKSESAYVYPKIVSGTPTQVVCKNNVTECPLYLSSVPKLSVMATMEDSSLTKSMLSLPPGDYGKCALTEKLAEFLGHRAP